MQLITPSWPAPENIQAYTTTRENGYSPAPFNSLNFGNFVDDSELNIKKNRQQLNEFLRLPTEPIWLKQVHSNRVINIDQHLPSPTPEADAAIATITNKICVVTTADCLPILICNRQGTKVAAVHAGWRGIAHGVIENTIKELREESHHLMAWLGPAIGPTVFEVSEDVLNTFLTDDPDSAHAFVIKEDNPGKWLANIFVLAKLRLNKLGLSKIYGGDHCTYTDEKKFYSYRRDQGKTGRMATLIWLSA